MSESSLHFKSVEITSARGIRRADRFSIDNLASVNVIYGSNGVGKSTTGLALYAMLVPSRQFFGDDCEVAGVMEVNGESWELVVTGSRGKASKQGKAVDYPVYTSSDQLSRYRLALEELIQSDDEEFAAIIARESRGGFDLDAVSRNHGFQANPQVPRQELARLSEQLRECMELTSQQQDLTSSEKNIELLEAKRHELKESLREIPVLDAIQRKQQYERELVSIEAKMAALPDVLEHLNGEDSANTQKLVDEIRAMTQSARQIEDELQVLQDGVGSCGLPEEFTDVTLDLLSADNEKLRNLHREQIELEKEITEVKAAADQCLSVFTEHVTPEAARAFQGPGWQEIEELCLDEMQCRMDREAGKRYLAVLQNDYSADELKSTEDELNRQMEVLQDWIQADENRLTRNLSMQNMLLCVAAVLTGSAAILLGWLVNPIWSVMLLVPTVLVVLSVLRSRANGMRGLTRAEVEKRGRALLELPVWNPQSVDAAVAAVLSELGDVHIESSKLQRRIHSLEEQETKDRKHDVALEKIRDWSERLGLTEVQIPNPNLFVSVVRGINRWNELQEKLPSLNARLMKTAEQVSAQQEKMVVELTRCGQQGETGLDDYAAHLKAVSKVFQQRTEQASQLTHKQEVSERDAGQLLQLQEELRMGLQKLGLSEPDIAQIRQWEKQRDQYLSAKTRQTELRALITAEQQNLADSPEALDWTDAVVDERREIAESAERELDKVSEEIIRIREKIENTTQAHGLHKALAESDRTEQTILAHRDKALEDIVGQGLMDWLSQQSAADNEFRIFQDAIATLSMITDGKLQLCVDPSADEEFYVLDSSEHRRSLDELSVGERVQVLLSIRMAFLSWGEGAALPLVLDEALGTSDDERAHDIINSVLKLAVEGRQVFYFTAQSDEVAKWQRLLEDYPKLSTRFVDLDQQRGVGKGVVIPDAGDFGMKERVPAPDGRDHSQYAEALGVRAANLFNLDVDRISLWYVVQDVDVLYQCWQRRVTTWGTLQHLLRDGGEEVGFLSAEQVNLIRLRMDILADVIHQWLIGRADAVSRRELLDSGAVTETWIDRIGDLLVESEYDGEQLISMLRSKKRPKGWRDSNTEKLEQYLTEIGKLSFTECIPAEKLAAYAISSLENHGGELSAHSQWLEWVLQAMLPE